MQGIADFTEFSAKDDVHSLREREGGREERERGRGEGEGGRGKYIGLFFSIICSPCVQETLNLS